LMAKTVARLEKLLIHQWLFHAPPETMNDPFEAKPHYQWPTTAEAAQAQRKKLEEIQKQQGAPFKKRRRNAAKTMAMPKKAETEFSNALRKSYSTNRMCCFTLLANDLLFWALYGDSHKGVCFEFDATQKPIGLAFKVHYNKSYPQVTIPPTQELDSITPMLTKSPDWEREREYRSILVKDRLESSVKVDSSGEYLFLPKHTLKAVYFGAEASDDDKLILLSILERGPFNPKIYHGELAPDRFEVLFESD
jgi:hypothetical protein